MRSVSVAFAALLASTMLASAADLPVYPMKAAPYVMAPGYMWNGFYIGGDAGYGFSALGGGTVDPTNAQALGFFQALGNPGSLGSGANGFVGNIHAGVNYQFLPSWILGLEVLQEWTSISQSGASTLAANLATVTSNSRVDWDGAVNVRLGYLFGPNLLGYAFGGLAYGNISQNAAVVCSFGTTFCFGNGNSNVHSGFDVGAGLEYAFASNMTLRIQYRYVDLGTQSLLFTGTGMAPASFNASDSARFNEVTGGLNFRF